MFLEINENILSLSTLRKDENEGGFENAYSPWAIQSNCFCQKERTKNF